MQIKRKYVNILNMSANEQQSFFTPEGQIAGHLVGAPDSVQAAPAGVETPPAADGRRVVVDGDPELTRVWEEEQAEKARKFGPPNPDRQPTSAEKNAAAAANLATHEQVVIQQLHYPGR